MYDAREMNADGEEWVDGVVGKADTNSNAGRLPVPDCLLPFAVPPYPIAFAPERMIL